MTIRYRELKPYLRKLVRSCVGAGPYFGRKYGVEYLPTGKIYVSIRGDYGRFQEWYEVIDTLNYL